MEPKHSLLLLPAEIRSEIFLLAVAGKLPVFFDFLPERVDPWCHYAGDLRLVGHVQPPLTQACRQLRNEVLPIFYGIDNQVIVDLTSTPNDESRGSWWEQLSQYKPHHTTLSNLTLRYDIDLYNIDVYDTARYIYFDLTAATTALPGPLKLEVRSDVSFDICFCDIGELLDRVNLAYTSFSQRTGPPEECPIIFMCAALERDFIRPLILSRGRHEHCGKCGRCRLSAKAGIPGFIRAQKDRRADEMVSAEARTWAGVVWGLFGRLI